MDDPTPGELARALERMREDLRLGFTAISTRLDRFVSSEVLAVYQAALDRRLADMDRDIAKQAERIEADADKRAAHQRWLIGLAVMTVVSIVLPLVNALRGVP